MDIRDKLSSLIEARGLKQTELACRVGVSKDRMSKWLAHTGMPNAHQARALARALEVDLDWLCDPTRGMDAMGGDGGPVDPAVLRLLRLMTPEEALRRLGQIGVPAAGRDTRDGPRELPLTVRSPADSPPAPPRSGHGAK
jgi:transcriptional regulator with XRE-family HTH domain